MLSRSQNMELAVNTAMIRLGGARDFHTWCTVIRVFYPAGGPATLVHDAHLCSGGDGYAVRLKVWTRYDIVFRVLAWNAGRRRLAALRME